MLWNRSVPVFTCFHSCKGFWGRWCVWNHDAAGPTLFLRHDEVAIRMIFICMSRYWLSLIDFTSCSCLIRELRDRRPSPHVKEVLGAERKWTARWTERSLILQAASSTWTTAPHLYSCSSSASASASTASSSSWLTSCLPCCPRPTALCPLKRRCGVLRESFL